MREYQGIRKKHSKNHDYPRCNTKWTSEEEERLKDLGEKSSEEDVRRMSVILGRSPAAIKSRIWDRDHGRPKRGTAPKSEKKEMLIDITPVKTVDPVKTRETRETREIRDEEGIDLVIWFCREAYLEGHEIVIPFLGASFRRRA